MTNFLDQSLERVQTFFEITTRVFDFLVTDNRFSLNEEIIFGPHDIREATAKVRYLKPKVGVEISWYFSPGLIDVTFVEAESTGRYPESVKYLESSYWTRFPNPPKGAMLSTLAAMLGKSKDPLFLLPDYNNLMPSKCKKRAMIIQQQMDEVLNGLALATRKYATAILEGDMSIFPAAISFYTKQHIDSTK